MINAIFILVSIPFIFFVIIFIAGLIKAAIIASPKRKFAFAVKTIAQLSKDEQFILKEIYSAYLEKDIKRANRTATFSNKESIKNTLRICDIRNRPEQFSSGNVGKMLWKNYAIKVASQGYNDIASKIITGIFMNDFDFILKKMISKSKNDWGLSMVDSIKRSILISER